MASHAPATLLCGFCIWMFHATTVFAQEVTPQAPGPLLPTGSPALPTGEAVVPDGSSLLPPLVPVQSATSEANKRRQRQSSLPFFFEHRRSRNLDGDDTQQPFTFRFPGDLPAMVSLGFQAEIYHSDNVNSAPASHAIADTIFDFTPIVRLNLGDPPPPDATSVRGTDFYFNAGYQPTIHRLIGENLTRTLQSGRAEIGRETDRSRLSLSFDYDERVFSSQSGNSPEESYTLLELTPLME